MAHLLCIQLFGRRIANPVRCLFRITNTHTQRTVERGEIMATFGPEAARPSLSQLGSSTSIQTLIRSTNLPPNRGLERALEEAANSGVLNLSSRKLKEFPRAAANHDLTDTVNAGRGVLWTSVDLVSFNRPRGHRCRAVAAWILLLQRLLY